MSGFRMGQILFSSVLRDARQLEPLVWKLLAVSSIIHLPPCALKYYHLLYAI